MTSSATTSASASASAAAAGLVNVSTHEITSLYKSRTVLLKLLAMRGYNVADYEGFGMHEIHTMVKHNQLDMLVSTKSTAATATAGAATKTYIKYAGFGMHAMKKIQQKDVYNIVDDLFVLEEVLTKNDTLIIVAGHQVNDTIVQLLDQFRGNLRPGLWRTDDRLRQDIPCAIQASTRSPRLQLHGRIVYWFAMKSCTRRRR